MKKIIQIVSFLGLAIIFGGVTANAQSSTTTVDANIPFDFVVGDKAFAAGKYEIRISKNGVGAQLLEVRNEDRDILYHGLISTNGDRRSNTAELFFERTSGQAVLARIVTQDSGYSLPEAGRSKLIAARGKAAGTVNN